MNEVIVLTPQQFEGIIEQTIERAKSAGLCAQNQCEKKYVHGLNGIRKLFNVSVATAQHYKNTFLAPAVIQRGRKLMVDVDMARELFNENRTK